MHGRLTNQAGVCLATLGPGAINLMLGVADANLDSSPLVALTAQASLDRIYKESHQIIDLVKLFAPITKWSGMIHLPETTSEMVRKAFKQAQSERMGAVALVLPEEVAGLSTHATPLLPQEPKLTMPNPQQIQKAADIINQAKNPIILAGAGVYRHHAEKALTQFAHLTKIPIAATFMAKGVISDKDSLTLGTIGF